MKKLMVVSFFIQLFLFGCYSFEQKEKDLRNSDLSNLKELSEILDDISRSEDSPENFEEVWVFLSANRSQKNDSIVHQFFIKNYNKIFYKREISLYALFHSYIGGSPEIRRTMLEELGEVSKDIKNNPSFVFSSIKNYFETFYDFKDQTKRFEDFFPQKMDIYSLEDRIKLSSFEDYYYFIRTKNLFKCFDRIKENTIEALKRFSINEKNLIYYDYFAEVVKAQKINPKEVGFDKYNPQWHILRAYFPIYDKQAIQQENDVFSLSLLYGVCFEEGKKEIIKKISDMRLNFGTWQEIHQISLRSENQLFALLVKEKNKRKEVDKELSDYLRVIKR